MVRPRFLNSGEQNPIILVFTMSVAYNYWNLASYNFSNVELINIILKILLSVIQCNFNFHPSLVFDYN